jgi:hypothetical protein
MAARSEGHNHMVPWFDLGNARADGVDNAGAFMA